MSYLPGARQDCALDCARVHISYAARPYHANCHWHVLCRYRQRRSGEGDGFQSGIEDHYCYIRDQSFLVGQAIVTWAFEEVLLVARLHVPWVAHRIDENRGIQLQRSLSTDKKTDTYTIGYEMKDKKLGV